MSVPLDLQEQSRVFHQRNPPGSMMITFARARRAITS